MRLKKIKVLSNDEIQAIHSASIELLSKVGIKIDSPSARNLFKENGAEVSDNDLFIRIPESLIKEKLKEVPNSFKLHGPDGKFNFEVNTTSTQFATIGTPVKIYDPSKKSGIRKTVLDDTIKQIRIVDSLKNINCSHLDVWPNDVNYLSLHVHCIYQWVHNTRKPYGLGCWGRVVSQDVINMASIIVGSEDELIKNARFVGFMNPTSPLHLPQLMTNGLEIFAKYNQPTIIAPEALAGATAPVTMAGLLTQINAEIIGGIILTQIYKSGAPVFFGTVSTITDMKSGNAALGSIETGLITTAIAQMARFYNIPSRGPGGITDSKVLDVQCGFERLQTLLVAAQAGINYITCAGTYEETLVESLELLVIDDELVDIVKRLLEGISVDEDTIALDVIKKVASSPKKGVNYLGEAHTRKYMREELFIPSLIDRNRRSTWRKKGAKDIIGRAGEKVKQILQSFIPPELDKVIENELLDYIKEDQKRTLEYYKKAEGISAGKVSLPGTEISINDQ
ncbi:MAG: trimethylamine methyltransferase family protein [Promethearchaeota archaeon]